VRHAIEPVSTDDAKRGFHQGAFALACLSIRRSSHVDITRSRDYRTNVLFCGS
jgi:hypothetical protein